MRNVGILIFDNIELLDFGGPYSVFHMANKISKETEFNIFTIAEEIKDIKTQDGLVIKTDYSIKECPNIDILVVSGGSGSRVEKDNKVLLDFIKDRYTKVEILLSVCTGSLILANTGLLKNLDATTHKNAINELRALDPSINVLENTKVVDNGKIVISAGVSTGIEASLLVVKKLLGKDIADKSRENIEY